MQPPREELNLSITQSFRPYYSPTEVLHLVKLQSRAQSSRHQQQQQQLQSDTSPLRPKEINPSKIEAWRQLACGYIDRVGQRLGFPRRTIATAQNLYHRFHLMYPFKDFAYQDVSLAAILVSSKLEDTLKKLREIQIAGYQIANMLEGGNGMSEGDTAAQEAHRPNLIAIERIILQTICFNFNLHRTPFILLPTPSPSYSPSTPPSPPSPSPSPSPSIPSKDLFSYTLRFSHSLHSSKPYTYLSHLIAIDSSRTLVALSYPVHTIALSCVYLASFFWREHLNYVEWKEGEEVTREVRECRPIFGVKGWEKEFESDEEDVENIIHSVLDMFISLCPSSTSSLLSGPPHATNATPSSTSTNPPYAPSPFSPVPHPSPIDQTPRNSSSSTTTTTTNNNGSSASLSERDKHLQQSGIPYTILHLSQQLGMMITQEDLTRIKIRLREIGRQKRGSDSGTGATGEADVGRKRKREEERWGGPGVGDEMSEEDRKKKFVSVRYRF